MIDRYSTPELKELWSELNRYRTWCEVELAATEAWEELGEIPAGTASRIRAALADSPLDEEFAKRAGEIERETRHDMVAFTRALTERVGEDGRFIHLGLTSTDVVDTAQNLLLKRVLEQIRADVQVLREAVRERAILHKHLPVVGRTHGIHAEPMTFGLKFLNFYAALGRDLDRLESAEAVIGVAMLSGSVGTYAHVRPEIERKVAQKLGLTVDPITNQTVARDRHAQLLGALAILGTTLERIAVEVRQLQRSEVREAQEGFARGQAGSSSMPHKKNPIASENISGVARLMRANLQAALEDVALWHERDISHSSVERVILPDTTTLASYATRRTTTLVEELIVYPDAMARNLDALYGLIYSQRVLHLLIEKGLMRERAYELVQRNSLRSWDEGVHLRELLASDAENPLSEEELSSAFDPAWYLRHVDAIYARFGI